MVLFSGVGVFSFVDVFVYNMATLCIFVIVFTITIAIRVVIPVCSAGSC